MLVTLILKNNEQVSDSIAAEFGLILKESGSGFEVIKNRYGNNDGELPQAYVGAYLDTTLNGKIAVA